MRYFSFSVLEGGNEGSVLVRVADALPDHDDDLLAAPSTLRTPVQMMEKTLVEMQTWAEIFTSLKDGRDAVPHQPRPRGIQGPEAHFIISCIHRLASTGIDLIVPYTTLSNNLYRHKFHTRDLTMVVREHAPAYSSSLHPRTALLTTRIAHGRLSH